MRILIILSLMVVIATSAVATPKHKSHATPKPAAQPANSSGYRGVGQTHELQSKNEDGTQVILNDHSVWSVDDGDASASSIWDANSKIDVVTSDDPSMPFKLTNKGTGETVHATFGGYRTTTAQNTP